MRLFIKKVVYLSDFFRNSLFCLSALWKERQSVCHFLTPPSAQSSVAREGTRDGFPQKPIELVPLTLQIQPFIQAVVFSIDVLWPNLYFLFIETCFFQEWTWPSSLSGLVISNLFKEKSFKKVVCVWELQLKAFTQSSGFLLQSFSSYVLGRGSVIIKGQRILCLLSEPENIQNKC